ncbi:MAG: GNAT family N-acetyltransferase [Spirochaetes bacterium]|nr:GNAT family N-acetyltransferase [Spirochaetota bacterium]
MSINILKFYVILVGLSKLIYGDFVEYELKMLKEVPFTAPVLAHWAYKTWYLKSGIDFKIVMSDYAKRDNTDSLPMTIVAVIRNSFPVGMVSLKKTDLQTRREFTPWLSALYVMPEFRNNGIAENLINYLLNFCKKSGINRVHLFIDKNNEDYLQNYYLKRGWNFFLQEDDHNGDAVKILSYDFM